jgi:hypothetical protein
MNIEEFYTRYKYHIETGKSPLEGRFMQYKTQPKDDWCNIRQTTKG